jgi:hypothetical protein
MEMEMGDREDGVRTMETGRGWERISPPTHHFVATISPSCFVLLMIHSLTASITALQQIKHKKRRETGLKG